MSLFDKGNFSIFNFVIRLAQSSLLQRSGTECFDVTATSAQMATVHTGGLAAPPKGFTALQAKASTGCLSISATLIDFMFTSTDKRQGKLPRSTRGTFSTMNG